MMFSRRTFCVWVGILMLSGMFLMGQDAWVEPPECVDTDGDGYGSPASTGCTYSAPDCDDTNPDVNPGGVEALYSDPVCHDGLDNDCDGWTDVADLYCNVCSDTDGDGYGDPASHGCIHPEADCDDSSSAINPQGVEAPFEDPVCSDGADNDCDGEIDGGDNGCSEPGDMAVIPGGCFNMGDAFSEGSTDERPAHNVCITGFEMDLHEVTNAEYVACVTDGHCAMPSEITSWTRPDYFGEPGYASYPVIFVDWNKANAYCEWAGKRLPSEAEWEYAARGGQAGNRYPWGDVVNCGNANYGRYVDTDPCYSYLGHANDTQQVQSYAPNGYGLYDMAGNVFEWVADYFGSTYYASSPVNDPPGPATGGLRVYRGGSWYQASGFLRVADRNNILPNSEDFSLGFRCARGGGSGY